MTDFSPAADWLDGVDGCSSTLSCRLCSASEMTYIVSGGALNSTHSLGCANTWWLKWQSHCRIINASSVRLTSQ